ncbi:hypothetical protein LAD12857_39900 [Lacrimispora amygdalina]|uniref:Condensation domain-containing protein n=1 Tax=Lacrimispora amygdalina TaxID=253257 RepID=A0ABQ5MB51_9FIRM
MDAIKLASLYFFGTEEFNSSNCMIATVSFKKKIDPERLYPSYRALVMENPLLQAKMVEQPEKNTFKWNRFPKEELKALLDYEEEQLSKYYTEEEVLERYDSTNSRLVFHLFPVNENTMVFSMHHAVTNGRGLIFWIKKWLEYYSCEIDTVPGETDASSGLRERILRTGRRISAYLWLPVFLTGFAFHANKKDKNETLDLSYDRKPKKGRGYVKKSYSFSAEKTREILRQSRRYDMTFGEYLCYRMTDGLLEHDSGKQRVLVSMPMDIQPLHSYSPQTMHGNYVASLPAQFFREGDLRKQVKEAFKWFKRGVPYGLLRLAAVCSSSLEKYKSLCLKSCKKTMSERGPLMNTSITLSNLGIISYPIMEKWVESFYISVRAQSLFLSSATISGRLMMELCVSKNLYDPEEVISLFDRILSEKHLLNS